MCVCVSSAFRSHCSVSLLRVVLQRHCLLTIFVVALFCVILSVSFVVVPFVYAVVWYHCLFLIVCYVVASCN